ncbi:unnamed protein product [Amoebophrya sp. A25]|nr:unnamed protein product [Amoebophrya sp. A25]|eukprot:GSA25T00013124001.1
MLKLYEIGQTSVQELNYHQLTPAHLEKIKPELT